jgi:NAD(P)-dependent dehydrogenase (short-subunit alcohol dehydrogenase family)
MQLTVRPLAIDTFRENTLLLSRDCRALRPERLAGVRKVEIRAGGRTLLAAVVICDDPALVGPLEAGLTQPAFRRLMVDTIPYPRLGAPADVASAVNFLCSDDASFINGHVLVIDGGWSATNWVG